MGDRMCLHTDVTGAPVMVAPVSRHNSVQLMPGRTRAQSAAARRADAERAAAERDTAERTAAPTLTPMPTPTMEAPTVTPLVPPDVEVEPLSPSEIDFHKSVEELSFADWAQEQRADSTCRAAIAFIKSGRSSPFPVNLLENEDPSLAPSEEDVLALAEQCTILEVDETQHSTVSLNLQRFIFVCTATHFCSDDDASLGDAQMSGGCVMSSWDRKDSEDD